MLLKYFKLSFLLSTTTILFSSFAYSQGVANYSHPTFGTGDLKEEIVWLTWDHVQGSGYEDSGLQNGTTTGGIFNGTPMTFTLPSEADFPGEATLTATFNNTNFTPWQGAANPYCSNTINVGTSSARRACGYQPGNMQEDGVDEPGQNFNSSNGQAGLDNSWQGSALQYGYNIPGREILFSNIGPGALGEPGQDGQQTSFDVDLSLTVGGITVPVDFVFSDAETTNGSGNGGFDESITATTGAGADPWQLIEIVGGRWNGTPSGGTLEGTRFRATGAGTNSVTIDDTEVGWNNTSSAANKNAAPIFLANNTSNVAYQFNFGTGSHNGHQGILIGLLFPKDHGDAPESYGHAAHFQDMKAGPNVTTDPTLENDSKISLGAMNSADNEQESYFTANADGDDNTQTSSAGIDDEDALTSASFPNLVDAAPGDTYTIPGIPVYNSTGSAARVCGWFDFDINGQPGDGEFENGTPGDGVSERACATAGGSAGTDPDNGTCTGSAPNFTCELSFTVPNDFVFKQNEPTFARFRVTTAATFFHIFLTRTNWTGSRW